MHYQTYDLNIFGEPMFITRERYVAVWEFLQRMGVSFDSSLGNFLDIGSGFDSGLIDNHRDLTKGLVALTQDGVSVAAVLRRIYGQITIVDLCNFTAMMDHNPLGDYGNTSEILAGLNLVVHDQRLIDLCDTSIISQSKRKEPPMFTAPTVQVGQTRRV
ncbi:hypothetical protein SPFM15_00007 [Salmonella phage SPFM15]|nr:hypothetical protein SPFM14_00001 [Salmonella phage SPFM14]VFR13630.1 hypothetical protein SPFM15_00007 [Salmonella phage SPFM15]